MRGGDCRCIIKDYCGQCAGWRRTVRKDFARVDYIMDGMEHLAESKIQIIGGILNGV